MPQRAVLEQVGRDCTVAVVLICHVVVWIAVVFLRRFFGTVVYDLANTQVTSRASI